MIIVPTAAVPAQVFRIVLGGQSCRLALSQKSTGLYLDLYVNNQPLVNGVMCLVGVRMVRSAYIRFNGDLAFIDNNPGVAPLVSGFDLAQVYYTGLGTRYVLAYYP